jgi:hypothetical protein
MPQTHHMHSTHLSPTLRALRGLVKEPQQMCPLPLAPESHVCSTNENAEAGLGVWLKW